MTDPAPEIMIVIAYYTDNYTEYINRLIKSCIKFGLSYAAKPIEDQGGWVNNCLYKPTFIRDMLEHYKEPVLYVDADAEFVQCPLLSKDDIDCDIAVHTLDWGKYRDKRKGYFELLSGTIYFNYTDKALEILNEWIEKCQNERDCFDQWHLDKIIHEKRGYFGDQDLRIYDLPAQYCYIKEIMTEPNPVILQHQASRETRRNEVRNLCSTT